MKILVANLGSTSFKFRLFDMDTEAQVARGGIDRIGAEQSRCTITIGETDRSFGERIPDHTAALNRLLDELSDKDTGCLSSVAEVSAIGFKAVLGGRGPGVRRIDENLLTRMDSFNSVAPAHNPMYIRVMRRLLQGVPDVPLIAAFETGFHDTIPEHLRTYAVPPEWKIEHEVQRWGFHGASHRYIALRTAELLRRDDLRVISCHLGGSSSVCAIQAGRSVATSMGMSPQSGLPNNNRVGDFDPFALPILMERTGRSLEELLNNLAGSGGLLGLSGLSGDVRDLELAAADGHERAELALRVLEASVRSYVGSSLSLLGGADVLVFTGGIGENSGRIRAAVCGRMEWAGLHLDERRNAAVRGETRIGTDTSSIDAWVIPTNEELIVARQAATYLRDNTLSA